MRRRALLLTTHVRNDEMEELVFALGVDLAATVLQKRPQPDPVTYLGTGKLEEARSATRAMGVDLVIVCDALRPGQIAALQRFFLDGAPSGTTVDVYDRTRLILEIFRERARSPEARLQVELAQLTYDMPLVKEAINAQKKGERQAAMFGGGQYGANDYFDMMKKRMARIRRDLEKMRLERGVRRKHRRRSGFHLVSLAGYTNAGKSSLLRALSEKETLVENRYFSTLSTKTARAVGERRDRSDRRERGPRRAPWARREILVTDTVGFIEDLPPWMVEAFHSTLEEIAMADVILLVLDASDTLPEMSRRLRSSLRILAQFESESASGDAAGVPYRRALAPTLVALNKVDRVEPAELATKLDALVADGLVERDMVVQVSAKTRDGLDSLYEKLYALIPDYDEYEVALPASPESESFLAWLYESADILDLTRGNEVHLHFEAKRSLRASLLARLASVGASALREAKRGALEPLSEGARDDAPPRSG